MNMEGKQIHCNVRDSFSYVPVVSDLPRPEITFPFTDLNLTDIEFNEFENLNGKNVGN